MKWAGQIEARMEFFTSFGWTDEIGSGIRNTNKYLPLYVPGARHVFYENDTFVTEIPLQCLSLAKFREEWINWLELNNMSDHLMFGLDQITLPSTLKIGRASWRVK